MLTWLDTAPILLPMKAFLLSSITRLLTGAQAQWQSAEPLERGQHIFFANHTSNLDFLLLWSVLPPALRRMTRPVAAQDYWSKTRLRQKLAEECFHALLIERNKVTRDNNPLPKMTEALQQGYSLILFPEGTRNAGATGEIGDFKSGLHHLASACPDVCLVPTYIENLSRVLPKGELLPLPLLCTVRFGAPLTFAPQEQRAEFLQRARQAVLSLRSPSS
jgi:1-acyl-sn-glycerol-3-phosphate acyltransferase